VKRIPITHHFLATIERPPNWTAVRFKRHKSWIDLSWLEYFRRGEAVGLGLAALGVKAGDRVAVLSNTRWEWAALDFGILGLGAVTVPIYQSNRPEEIEFVLKDCAARVLVVEDSSQLLKWEGLGKKCKSVEAVICIQPTNELPPGVLSWDDFLDQGIRKYADHPDFYREQIEQTKLTDVASIVYTSGTTGDPKGAILTHSQIISEVEDLVRAFPISAQDATLCFLPYAHVLGRVELWLHTYLGFTLNFAESIDRLRANLREVQPTVIIGVPRIFEKIFSSVMTETQSNPWRKNIFKWLETPNTSLGVLDLPRKILADRVVYSRLRQGLGGKLRFTVSGGAPLEAEIAEFFHKAGLLILEGYGLTETTAAVTVNTPSDYEFGTVGKPLNDVEIKLAEDGEILVKSKKVMEGYYQQDEDTKKVFQDGYFCTGDIGEWTARGFLRVTDRKKDLIKTAGGKYVAPQRLEGLLKLDPLVSNVLIHGDRKKYVVALLTLDEANAKKFAQNQGWNYRDYKALTQSHEMKERLRKTVAQVNTKLASYETIKHFAILPNDFTVESGELTPSLKVKRRVADERYKDIIAGLY
jgi:long-chain acyl-CoA synthetase